MADEGTPLKKSANSFYIITQHQRGGDSSGGRGEKKRREKPLVQESMRAESIFPNRVMVSKSELDMMETLRINEKVQSETDTRVKLCLESGKVKDVILAFTVIGRSYTRIDDPVSFEKSNTTHKFNMKSRQPITIDQLCLDLEDFPMIYKSLVSMLSHLKRAYSIPIHTILARIECSRSNGNSTSTTGGGNDLLNQLWNLISDKSQQGYYYKLYIDFTQTDFTQ